MFFAIFVGMKGLVHFWCSWLVGMTSTLSKISCMLILFLEILQRFCFLHAMAQWLVQSRCNLILLFLSCVCVFNFVESCANTNRNYINKSVYGLYSSICFWITFFFLLYLLNLVYFALVFWDQITLKPLWFYYSNNKYSWFSDILFNPVGSSIERHSDLDG